MKNMQGMETECPTFVAFMPFMVSCGGRHCMQVRSIGLSVVVMASLVACDGESRVPLQPTPTVSVTTVVPISGPTDGTTEMQIRGSGFQAGVTLTLGGNAMRVLASNGTMIAAVTPSHEAGTVDLVITNPDGGRITRTGAFTYVPFEVSAVDPSAGLAGGAVSIVGNGFQAGTTATFAGVTAIARFVNNTRITVIAPAHAPGAIDVAVIDPSGVRRTVTGGFVYETVTLTPDHTVVAAGEPVSVTWSAPAGRSGLDWIGFFKIGEPSTNYVSRWWDYTDGGPSGTLRLTAPSESGQYEFRYLPNDGFIDAGRSTPVTVVMEGRTFRFGHTDVNEYDARQRLLMADPAIGPAVRTAELSDVPAIVAVTNLAYKVEEFFVIGARTSETLVRELMARVGTAFLVVDDPTRPGALAASVLIERRGDRGYFAMLAVDPASQGKGLARALIEKVESECRRSGCEYLDIDVINLRTELPAFYARFGFTVLGTAPFKEPHRLKRDAHTVLMTKRLLTSDF